MVWGLISPGSLGDYFPDGEFVGWYDGLRAYRDTEMPAELRTQYLTMGGAIAYEHHVVQKFTREQGTIHAKTLPALDPILPHEPPAEFHTIRTYSSLASLIKLNSGLLAVDDSLKSIIERVEPGVHQFFPITITMPKGAVYPKRYHTLVIGRFLDSFSPKQSVEGSWRKGEAFYSPYVYSKKYFVRLAFSRSVFGDAHLWRERRLSEPEICFSDTLQKEIASAGPRLPKHYKLREV